MNLTHYDDRTGDTWSAEFSSDGSFVHASRYLGNTFDTIEYDTYSDLPVMIQQALENKLWNRTAPTLKS